MSLPMRKPLIFGFVCHIFLLFPSLVMKAVTPHKVRLQYHMTLLPTWASPLGEKNPPAPLSADAYVTFFHVAIY